MDTMKPKQLLTTICSASAALFLLLPPDRGHAAEPSEAPELAAAVLVLQAQQTLIAQNQTKIDEQIAAIEEELRLARIFVSRGGQK